LYQAEDGIRDPLVTGGQTCALPILLLQRDEFVPEGQTPSRSRDFVPGARRTLCVGLEVDRERLVGGDLAQLVLVQLVDVAAAPQIGRASCRERREGCDGRVADSSEG